MTTKTLKDVRFECTCERPKCGAKWITNTSEYKFWEVIE